MMPRVVWQSAVMGRLIEMVRRVAPTEISVLIYGETGTGKEMIAHMLHECSARSDGPFKALNCGGLTQELTESTLFGHRKGSFTGATADYEGYFVAASGGTLFLDELCEMPRILQAELLRALQEQEITPVGSNKPVGVNVRVLAASSRDLEQDVARGKFHMGLFYRIGGFPITVPPLRDRKDDIAPLAVHFCRRRKVLSVSAIRRLETYPWPGNVRELRSAIDYACTVCEGSTILVRHLPEVVVRGVGVKGAAGVPTKTLIEIEDEYILRVLKYTNWHKGRAAEILGVNQSTIWRRLDRMIRRRG